MSAALLSDLALGRLATWAPILFAVSLVLLLCWRERSEAAPLGEEADDRPFAPAPAPPTVPTLADIGPHRRGDGRG